MQSFIAMFCRIITNIRRRCKAKKLRICFRRSRGFRIPSAVTINGQKVNIYYPENEGIKSTFTEIFLDDQYRLEILRREDIKTILDIGAEIGLFCVAARNVYPRAALMAYEPNLKIEHYLKKNTETLGIRYFMEAVGLGDGRVDLINNKMLGNVQTVPSETGSITQVSFKKAIERMGGSADLVKMDCEGAEWEILKDSDTWQKVRFLTMEYHLWPKRPTIESVKQAVRALGFNIKRIQPLSEYTGMVLARKG